MVKLDEGYIMQALKKKHSCYCEVVQIKQALKYYLGLVSNNTPGVTNNDIINFNEISQVLYQELVLMKSQKPLSELKWIERFHTTHNLSTLKTFTTYTKVQKHIDKKLILIQF